MKPKPRPLDDSVPENQILLPQGISVIVPVYGSEATIEPLTERLAAELSKACNQFEVLLVNDCSPDESWQRICNVAKKHAWIRGISLMRNYGQHNATLCGVREARYSRVVTMDDDLQHPPEEVSTLLAKLDEGYDLVYGIPANAAHSWTRNFITRLTKCALRLATGQKQVQEINAFRAFRTDLRSAFASFRSPQIIFDVLLCWGTTKVAAVPVRHEARKTGQSNYGLWRLANQTMLVLTGFSTAPLRFASLLGFLFVLFGFGVLTYVIGRFILEGSVPGFPFLAAIVTIFGGTQLFALGMIGEYIARIFTRSLEQPPYVVREFTRVEGSDDYNCT